MEQGRSRFRNRVFGIVGGLLILTLPEIFEGLRIIISITVLIIAEAISREQFQKAHWGLRNLEFSNFVQTNGQIQRIALVDC